MAAMHWGRGSNDYRVSPLNTLSEISSMKGNRIFFGDLRRSLLIAADQARDYHARYAPQGIKVLLTKGSLARNADIHCAPRRIV
jgi:hypothetical protein